MRDRIEEEALASSDEIDELFGRANPNPARIGCPPPAVRVELAHRQRKIGDPEYLHLARCSECYAEVRALQASFTQSPAALRTSTYRLVAAAAVVLFFAASGWLAVWPPSQVGPPTTSVVPASVTLDLRSYEIKRGDQSTVAPADLTLPRERLSLTILLPIGSEPGAYAFELVDTTRSTRASSKGNATLVDFVTTLRVDVNLSALPPDRYEIGLRKQGDDWRFYPATIE